MKVFSTLVTQIGVGMALGPHGRSPPHTQAPPCTEPGPHVIVFGQIFFHGALKCCSPLFALLYSSLTQVAEALNLEIAQYMARTN